MRRGVRYHVGEPRHQAQGKIRTIESTSLPRVRAWARAAKVCDVQCCRSKSQVYAGPTLNMSMLDVSCTRPFLSHTCMRAPLDMAPADPHGTLAAVGMVSVVQLQLLLHGSGPVGQRIHAGDATWAGTCQSDTRFATCMGEYSVCGTIFVSHSLSSPTIDLTVPHDIARYSFLKRSQARATQDSDRSVQEPCNTGFGPFGPRTCSSDGWATDVAARDGRGAPR
jgi:hypothetical protein